MSSTNFTHLHVHTQYSLLEGAIPIEGLLKRVKELGMSSVAITDSGNLFGAIEFYLAAKKEKIKPIIGCEINYAPEGKSGRLYHLVLLCKNQEGYRNLCELVTRSYTEALPPQKNHAPVRPSIDRELLNRFGSGLLILSGCLRGEIPFKVLSGDDEGALASLQWFHQHFKDDFYLELQDSPLPEQQRVNEALYRFGKKEGIQCVATADCHYLESTDAEAHEVLQCIEHGRNLDFDRPKSLAPPEYFLKSPQEMQERFSRFEGAVENASIIASKCELEFKFKDENGKSIYHLPQYLPEGLSLEERTHFDLNQYFKHEARQGLEIRFNELSFQSKKSQSDWPEKEKSYQVRLEEELTMIEQTGFSGYFLIVADFINWAKRNDIPVGPGRGSGVGSLVSYALRITDLDPIQYKLLFERFINPERISMPDFDVDFCQDRRAEVIAYVSKRYGEKNVCQIITFGKLMARGVIKDVGRVHGLTFAEMDQITKLIPEELHITLQEALDKEPRLQEKINSDSRVARVFKYALSLEGLCRNAGVHAAGVIITDEPVVTYCPLFVARDGAVVSQFDKDSAEAIGLVKFDFLGLKTLTVINNAVKFIKHSSLPGSAESLFRIDTIPMDDPKVYERVSSGDTDGVFQVESSGMKDLCVRIQPSNLEDLTAINGLFRPGPLGSGMVDDYIDCKHGRKPIYYEVPELEPILKETYGVILFQEQVMQIARELAGYSLGQADLLRRAMGKKKTQEMARHREIFVNGAVQKGLVKAQAEKIFDLMAKFAEYGFNKSHSAAYAVLTYQTAYLKTHFPSEFMAALMTTEMDNTDKLTKYIRDAKAHSISVLAPDVNASGKRFSVEKKSIRFGLEAIKGVGGVAVDTLLEARTAGPFKSVLDFCKRVSTRKVNKKVMESLTHAGAFDSIAEVNRASLFASLEALLEHAGDEQEERSFGQGSLFDAFQEEEVKLITPASQIFKQEADWPIARKLAREKEVVGFFVSGHPMDTWQSICEDWLGWSTEQVKAVALSQSTPPSQTQKGKPSWRPQRTEVKLGGLFTGIKEITTKKGTRMAFAEFEDLKGKLEVIFFPEAFALHQGLLKKAVEEAEPVLLVGELERGEEAPKVFAQSLSGLTEAHENRVECVKVQFDPSKISEVDLREFKKVLMQHRGKCPVKIEFVNSDFKTYLDLPAILNVAPTVQMVSQLNQIFGSQAVKLK